jgi:hypothetical protein
MHRADSSNARKAALWGHLSPALRPLSAGLRHGNQLKQMTLGYPRPPERAV